jgi:hypothetical protein
MLPKRKYLSEESNDIVTKPIRSYRRLIPYPSPSTTSEVQLTNYPPFTFAPAAASSHKDSFDYDNFDFNSLDFNCLDFDNPDLNIPDFNVPEFDVPNFNIPDSNSFTFNNLDWNCLLWNDMTPTMPPATLSRNTAQQSQDAQRKQPRLYVPERRVYGSADLPECGGKIPTPSPDICDNKADISHQQANESLTCIEQGLDLPSMKALGSMNEVEYKYQEERESLRNSKKIPTPPPLEVLANMIETSREKASASLKLCENIPTSPHPPLTHIARDNHQEADAIKSSIKSESQPTANSVPSH